MKWKFKNLIYLSRVSKVATTFPNATPPPTDAQRVLNKGYLVSSQEPNKSNVLDVNFTSLVHTASNLSSKLQHLYL
jgi:hypothetical protein